MPGTQPQIDNRRSYELTQLLHNHMNRYGYKSVDLPIIEDADLFLIKAGDQIVTRLFTFERHGKQLALRPEFTVSAAYHYLAEQRQQSIVRWQFSGYVFEDDPNDVQANHQHLSIGAELIGMSEPVADAEIISMAANGLSLHGLNGWTITIGHIGLLRQMLARFQIDNRIQRFLLNHITALNTTSLGKAFVLDQLDKLLYSNDSSNQADTLVNEPSMAAESETQQMLDVVLDTTYRGNTMGGRTRYDIAQRLSQKQKRFVGRDHIIDALNFLEELSTITGLPQQVFLRLEHLIPPDDLDSQKLLSNWRQLIDLLSVYNIDVKQVRIQPTLSRSWDYYTGMIFELRGDGEIHLGGGGRYDGLTRLIGGQEAVPAVGFTYYADKMLNAVPDTPTPQRTELTIVFDDDSAVAATRWAEVLRAHDFSVQLLPNISIADKFLAVPLYARQDMTLGFEDQSFSIQHFDILLALLKGK